MHAGNHSTACGGTASTDSHRVCMQGPAATQLPSLISIMLMKDIPDELYAVVIELHAEMVALLPGQHAASVG